MSLKPAFLCSRLALASIMASLAWAQPCLSQIHVLGDYPTIQEAVDAAASGMTITVAAGQYEEQVLIEAKNLTLQGELGATLVSPPTLAKVDLGGPLAAPRRPALAATGCKLDLRGLAFDGVRRGGDIVGLTGVLYVSSSGSVSDCSFMGFRPQANGPLHFNPIPERAIQMVNSSGVVQVAVRGNHVSDHEYLGSDSFSIAILAGGLGLGADFVMQRVLLLGNTTENNNVGVLSLFGDRSLIRHNTVIGGRFGFSGIAVSGSRNKIIHNRIEMDQSVVPGNSGVLLLGAEFDAGFGTGFARDTLVVVNTIIGAFLPIWSQSGVTGTIEFGNILLP